VLLGLYHCIVYDFTFLFEIKQISFLLWSRHFYTTKLKTLCKLQTNFNHITLNYYCLLIFYQLTTPICKFVILFPMVFYICVHTSGLRLLSLKDFNEIEHFFHEITRFYLKNRSNKIKYNIFTIYVCTVKPRFDGLQKLYLRTIISVCHICIIKYCFYKLK
jgi:hypothetical protein